jgi:hypothetical protein
MKTLPKPSTPLSCCPTPAGAEVAAASTWTPRPVRWGGATHQGQLDRGGRTPHVTRHHLVAGQQTAPECPDLVLHQLTCVIAQPNRRRRTRGHDHQRAIDRVGPCRRQDLLHRLRTRPTLAVSRCRKRERRRSVRCRRSAPALCSARTHAQDTGLCESGPVFSLGCAQRFPAYGLRAPGTPPPRTHERGRPPWDQRTAAAAS